jgi:hypothetical protein
MSTTRTRSNMILRILPTTELLFISTDFETFCILADQTGYKTIVMRTGRIRVTMQNDTTLPKDFFFGGGGGIRVMKLHVFILISFFVDDKISMKRNCYRVLPTHIIWLLRLRDRYYCSNNGTSDKTFKVTVALIPASAEYFSDSIC